ncbi:flavin reductase family protein [Corynebacterium sp. A21]|uniref:flavin reductase family protein n=1 Tax=Corynebacterium sp. A21 TaxID=3457318 RepID=UPI003FCFDB2E
MNSQAVDPAIIGQDLKNAFRSHPAGVAVVTADPGNGPVGLTATSVTSVSMDPPTIAFSLSALSSSGVKIRTSEYVVVHLLSADQIGLAQLFATSGIDRFADTSKWGRLATGEPYLKDSEVWMRGKITGSIDINGSALVAVEIIESQCTAPPERVPLVYCNRTWHQLSETSALNEGK